MHAGVERSSAKRLEDAAALEAALLDALREAAPDLHKGGSSALHLRLAAQRLKDAGHAGTLPQTLARIVRSLAANGRDDAARLLDHLLAQLPAGARGTVLPAATTLGKLLAAVEADLTLRAETADPQRLVDRALL